MVYPKPSVLQAQVVALSAALCISGCVSAQNVYEFEMVAQKEAAPRTYASNVEYAKALADAYIRLSDRAATAQDVAAVALIATAGVAAGALLYDGSLDLVKGAGLAAGALTATTTYFKPGEASGYLLEAAGQLVCIGKVSQPPPSDTVSGAEILNAGIMTVRLNLRKKFSRTLPDYKKMLQEIQALGGMELMTDTPGRTLEDLQAAINVCML